MGKGGKQTIGHKYYIGTHMVLCQSPIDQVVAMKWQDEIAWEGNVSGGRFKIHAPSIFGGAEKEGGVSGYVDFLPGDAAQLPNDYLQSVQDSEIPAYRGVASLVMRQMYIGNNPYLKPISVKVRNVVNTFEGWRPDLAPIGGEFSLNDTAIYIALDYSRSMLGTAVTNQAVAAKGFIDRLKGTTNSVRIVAYNLGVVASLEILDCNDADYDALQVWIDALPAPDSGTGYDAAVSLAPAFFTSANANYLSGDIRPITATDASGILQAMGGVGDTITGDDLRKIVILLTDGEPTDPASATAAKVTLDSIGGVEVFAININLADTTYTALLDNTAIDGVPVVSSEDPDAIEAGITNGLGSWIDINPAHILRDLIVSPTSGGDGNAAAIGASFVTAATTLFAEGFGLSIFHENTGDRNGFKNLIERHIDASVYFDRSTSLWEIKLIRDDYDLADLFTFDASNIVEFVENAKPLQEDLPNQITVVYTKRPDGTKASLTVTNVAAVQMLGQVIPEKVEYLGINQTPLAAKVAARDLAALTVPLRTGAIRVVYAPLSLNIGSPFILNEPRLGITNLVCRVTEIEEGDGRDNSVLIRYVEDRFGAVVPALVSDGGVVVADDRSAQAPLVSFAEEVPYYVNMRNLGQAALDELLILDPDAGYFHATSDRPNNFHVDADVALYDGATWTGVTTTDFAPIGALLSALAADASAVSFEVSYNDTIPDILAGDLCSIGAEIMRVDDITEAAGVVTVTVGRGCLDTVPAVHLAGAYAVFWFDRTAGDEVQYTAGQSLDVGVFPRTALDGLTSALAVIKDVDFDSRAIRPYPVGKLQIEGEYAPTTILPDTIGVTWQHRDRIFQTTDFVEDHTAASIGPEVGVDYVLQLRAKVGRANFFAPADCFAEDDFFIESGPGALIREQQLGQSLTVDIAESGVFDFFALADFFDTSVTDFFAATPPNFFASPDFFDATALPDFFSIIAGDALRTEVMIVASRDGYENWQAPSVSGGHLVPAGALELEAY